MERMLLKRITKTAFSMGIILLLFSMPTFAGGICPKIQVNSDGCTGAILYPTMAAHFWGSCKQHDTCYSTMGAERSTCDSSFRRDMRSDCNSKYNKYLLPGLNQSCKAAAELIYNAVRAGGESYYDDAQDDYSVLITQTIQQIQNESCATTPERVGLISNVLIDFIEAEFMRIKGRAPGMYEYFDMLALYDIDQSTASWKNRVTDKISQITLTPPKINLVKTNFDGRYKLDASSSQGNALAFDWRINNTHTSGPVYTKSYFQYPTYTQVYYFKGYLYVTDGINNRNFQLIDDKLTIKGLCSNGPGGVCNQIP